MRRQRIHPFTSGLLVVALMLAAMVGVVVSGIPSGPSITLPWNHQTTIKLQLADADALAPHAGVQIAGVKVGEVRSVDSEGDHALVTLTLDSRYADVHRDARIALRPHGLFGPKYVEITPGTPQSPLLGDGDTITIRQTVQPVDLDQILKALQAPEAENLRTFLVEFGKAAAGRGDDTNHLITAADALTQSLQTPLTAVGNVKGNLSDMIVQNEAFNSSFSQAPLDQLVANNEQTLQAFAANADHLRSVLDHADSALTQLDAALNNEGGNLHRILDTLPSTIDQLTTFNQLLALFGANLTGKDKTVPNDTDVTNGIIAAIENPKSALASSDPCTPGQNHCGPDGRQHYVRVQVFNLAGTGNATSTNGFPLCILGILNAPPGIPSKINCPPSTASTSGGVPGPSLASDDGNGMVSGMLRA